MDLDIERVALGMPGVVTAGKRQIMLMFPLDSDDSNDDTAEEWLLFSWPQTWTNAGCGFPGHIRPGYTTAQTIAIVSEERDAVAVFHGGMFAYATKLTERMKAGIAQKYLPGQIEFTRYLKAKKAVQ